jgi:hypothetical protein
MGVVVISAIEALLSSNPGMVAVPTVNSAVIVATMAASIAQELSRTPDRVYPEAGQGVMVMAQPGAVQAGQEQGGLALLFAALGEEARGSDGAADQALLDLMGCPERVKVATGQTLIRQAEHQGYLYFLDAGELSVDHQAEDGRQLRLTRQGPGTIMGELSLYLGTPASATVTAALPSTVYRLSSDDLGRLEREDPLAAMVLHRFLLKRTGQRLLSALETVDELSD